jgi:endonuclease/exonuclease/phosphatase family metal-dependent hydrolase
MSSLFRFLVSFVVLLILATTSFAQTQRIRIMAANTTSGNNQSYLAPGERIFQGLKPDVVLIQEFTIGSSASQDTTTTNNWVATHFGPGFSWMREAGNEQLPNGVISRWPIIASGEWVDTQVSNRDFAWARIDIPGDKDLWVVSVHLLTTGSSVRNSQAQALVGFLNAANIPAGDYVVIGGDFNTDNRTESAVSTFRSYLGVGSSAEKTPADQNGNSDTNAGRNKPYDWVLPNAALNARHAPVVIGGSTYANGLVFDSRVYRPLSEVSPVQSGDSGVAGMQHMAVVKDFLVPVTEADFTLSAPAVDFGTVNASSGPFTDATVIVQPRRSFSLTGVQFTGTGAAEFALAAPSLPASLSVNTPLEIRWTPAGNDGQTRSVTARFTTGGTPSSFEVELSGRTSSPGGGGGDGDPLDASGYTLEQSNSTVTVTLPAGTSVPERGFIVIGRDATKAQFEAAWGVTLADNVVYLNGKTLAAGNGFPVINGDELYVLRNSAAAAVDPPTGTIPTGGVKSGNSHARTATNATTFTARGQAQATPGTYEGTSSDTGRLVITEVSDATNFQFEFVELYYDAFTPAPVSRRESWMVR